MSIESLMNQLTDDAYTAWQDTPTPWTIEDMNRYYAARQDSREVTHALHKRREMHHVGYPVTPLDDFQVQRDPSYAENNRKIIDIFNELQGQIPSEEFEKKLFILLSIYREKLGTAQPDDDMRDVCSRMDMINRHLAFKFIKAIEAYPVDVKQVKRTLTQLGALASEIFPWVSVGLRKRLFDDALSSAEVACLVESAMVFYRAMDDVPGVEGIFNAIGMGSTKPYVKYALQLERLVWEGMYDADNPEKTLNNWVRYLKAAVLSRLVVSKINASIKQMQEMPNFSPANKKRAMLVLDMLAECVRREPYLVQGNDERALFTEDSFLPISAEVFYNRLDADADKTTALIQDYAETTPDVLKEIIFFIFSDKTYTVRHEALLAAAAHPTLIQAYDPLFALRKHGSGDAVLHNNILKQYWMHMLDSGLLTETNFFADEENQRLFECLPHVLDDMPEEITSNSKRMKTLCHALALYRATQLDQHALYMNQDYAIMVGQLEIKFVETSDWAEQLLYRVLNGVAYPDGVLTMNFEAVVRFLGLELNQPVSYEREAQQEIMTRDIVAFSASHPEMSVAYQEKLLHVFAALFMQREKLTEHQTAGLYPATLVTQLPTLCAHILDIMVLKNSVDVPRWFSLLHQMKISSVLNAPTVNQGIQQVFHASSIQMLERLDEKDPEQFQAMLQSQSAWGQAMYEQFSPKHQMLRGKQQVYFILEMYRAYCHQKSTPETTAERDFWAAQDALQGLDEKVAPVKAYFQEVKNSLQQHDKIVASYNSRWWRWIGSVLGYDVKESREQLRHVTQLARLLEGYDLRTLDGCQAVRAEIQDAVSKQTFKRSFWKSSTYHDALIALNQKLDGLEAEIKAQNSACIEEGQVEEDITTTVPTPAPRAVNNSTFTYGASLIKTMFSSCLGCCDKAEGVVHDDQHENRI